MENGKRCRICQQKSLDLILDLGHHPPSDAFLLPDQLDEPETHYPLALYYCNHCGLVQIGHTVMPELLFNETYPYETGINLGGVAHFMGLADHACDKCHPRRVIDIGSNDGTLLAAFRDNGCEVLGVEPVKPIAEKAKVKTINAFWSLRTAKQVPKADMITATNVLAHVSDLHGFVDGVAMALSDGGTFIVEAPYLMDLVNSMEYDTIYHEHLCYFSLRPMQYLMKMHGLVVYDYEHVPVHGGTLRYFIGKNTDFKPCIASIEGTLWPLLIAFAEKVEKNRFQLMKLLYDIKSRGKTIVGVSAPAKGNTLLNYCGINSSILDYITEKSTLKIGRYTPGSHILVVPDEILLKEQPDYALLLAWNWKDQIKKSLSGFKGKWILPVPEAVVE